MVTAAFDPRQVRLEDEWRRLDAVNREFRLHLVIQLGRFEQRLGRNAARIQAGATERRRAVEVLPLVDARNAELVLTRADRSRVARRTATDDDDVERISVSHVGLSNEGSGSV